MSKQKVRVARATAQAKGPVTVGELIAAVVDAVGTKRAAALFAEDSPLQKVLKRRLVVV